MKIAHTILVIVGCALLILSGIAGSIMAGLVGAPGERALALLAAAVAGLGLINAAALMQHRT